MQCLAVVLRVLSAVNSNCRELSDLYVCHGK